MLTLIKRTAVAVMAMSAGVAMAETRLQGAGATFPNPIYQRWVTEYQKVSSDVKIDYQSIGSGGGIKGLTEKTVDFAGSDAPMGKKEIEAAGSVVVHIPTVAGAVVPAYNLPGFSGDLKLTGEIIADIYLGKIAKWNDSKIAAVNEGATLPDLAITPAWRTDGSGTTFVFTNYLITQSEDFKGTIGAGKQVQFKAGQGGKGNEGVTAVVQQTPGSIGYIELNYALKNKIAFASVRNVDGNFIKASPATVSAAGVGALSKMTADKLQVDIWNQSGKDAYPISAFTYILVYKDLNNIKDESKAKALVGFLNWAVTDGQKLATEMDYAPLAPEVAKLAQDAIKGLSIGGKPVASAQ